MDAHQLTGRLGVEQIGQAADGGEQVVDRRGHEAGERRGGAVALVEGDRARHVVGGAGEHRVATAAVDVDVDEPGQHPPPVEVHGRRRRVTRTDAGEDGPVEVQPPAVDDSGLRDDASVGEGRHGRPC